MLLLLQTHRTKWSICDHIVCDVTQCHQSLVTETETTALFHSFLCCAFPAAHEQGQDAPKSRYNAFKAFGSRITCITLVITSSKFAFREWAKNAVTNLQTEILAAPLAKIFKLQEMVT